MESFVKNTAVRFRKTDIPHEELEKIFRIQEREGYGWRLQYLDALFDGNSELVEELTKDTKVTVEKFVLDTMFNEFSLQGGNHYKLLSSLSEYGDNFVLDIFGDNDTLKVKTTEGEITAIKLWKIIPEIQRFYPDIDKKEREGNCHQLCLEFVRAFNINCDIATGYVAPLSQKNKNLHSWIELNLWGEDMVIDFTRGLMFNKEGYYSLKNIIGGVQKIPRNVLFKEWHIFKYLADKDGYYSKLYLANREESLAIYQKLRGEEFSGVQPQ